MAQFFFSNVTRGIYLRVPRPAIRETSVTIRPSTAMATRDVSVTKTSHAAEFLATFTNSRRPETGTASYKTIYIRLQSRVVRSFDTTGSFSCEKADI